MGQHRVKKHSSKIFKSEKHPGVAAFDLCTESGYCWAQVVAAFFLIWGYFSTHQVVFRPWGLQNTKNAFYKKMLCDQASDKIIFIYQTTRHVPPVVFYNRIDQLSTAASKINPLHYS